MSWGWVSITSRAESRAWLNLISNQRPIWRKMLNRIWVFSFHLPSHTGRPAVRTIKIHACVKDNKPKPERAKKLENYHKNDNIFDVSGLKHPRSDTEIGFWLLLEAKKLRGSLADWLMKQTRTKTINFVAMSHGQCLSALIGLITSRINLNARKSSRPSVRQSRFYVNSDFTFSFRRQITAKRTGETGIFYRSPLASCAGISFSSFHAFFTPG